MTKYLIPYNFDTQTKLCDDVTIMIGVMLFSFFFIRNGNIGCIQN
jgi:hypothetical protein